MYEAYGDRVAFFYVYIREAHADDEWQLEDNRRDGVVFAQPASLQERRKAAQGSVQALGVDVPCLVDDMNNTADEAYAAWPERLFVVDVDGRIAYAGGQGPWGFKPEPIQKWLRKNVGRPREPQ